MKTWIKCCTAVAVAAATVSSLVPAPHLAAAPQPELVRTVAKKSAPRVQWQSSWPTALREAKRTGRPIFVDFYATWCGPCKLLDKHVYTNANFVTASRKWVMLKVDAERNTKLAEANKISAFPTLIFYSPQGKTVSRQIGFSVAPEHQNSEKELGAELARQMVRTLNQTHSKASRGVAISVSFPAQ